MDVQASHVCTDVTFMCVKYMYSSHMGVQLSLGCVGATRMYAHHVMFLLFNRVSLAQRLDKEQLDHLTMHSGAARPLWLAIACEELRLFGDFSTLTREIASLPPQLERLLARVLQRLLREDDTDLMRPVGSLISPSIRFKARHPT